MNAVKNFFVLIWTTICSFIGGCWNKLANMADFDSGDDIPMCQDQKDLVKFMMGQRAELELQLEAVDRSLRENGQALVLGVDETSYMNMASYIQGPTAIVDRIKQIKTEYPKMNGMPIGVFKEFKTLLNHPEIMTNNVFGYEDSDEVLAMMIVEILQNNPEVSGKVAASMLAIDLKKIIRRQKQEPPLFRSEQMSDADKYVRSETDGVSETGTGANADGPSSVRATSCSGCAEPRRATEGCCADYTACSEDCDTCPERHDATNPCSGCSFMDRFNGLKANSSPEHPQTKANCEPAEDCKPEPMAAEAEKAAS